MRFGCRVLFGAVFLIVALGASTQAQEFPIVLYNALSPDSIADPDSQYNLMKNLGATHLMGEATDSMVSLAAAKGMKVIKTGAIHHPKKYEECLPYCNPGDLNDYTNNLFPISSSCPKYLERFTDWGYKTDFEMENF